MAIKFSVVTPSYNSSRYIDRCIESVQSQKYSNFEHIIIDGASTDDTIKILKSYPHLNWLSEPDRGEIEAVNKGLKMVTGDIIVWLNTDDYLLDNTFENIERILDSSAETHVIYGHAYIVNEQDQITHEKRVESNIDLPKLMRWWLGNQGLPHQSSMFFSRHALEVTGLVNQNLHFSADLEYWIRLARKFEFKFINEFLSSAKLFRKDAKSYNTISAQIASHWRVTLPVHCELKLSQQVSFWADYWTLYVNNEMISHSATQDYFCASSTIGIAEALISLGNPNEALFHLSRSLNTKVKDCSRDINPIMVMGMILAFMHLEQVNEATFYFITLVSHPSFSEIMKVMEELPSNDKMIVSKLFKYLRDLTT
ncbi:MAG: glycosyltransferase family 2 protein [Snowella sp.]|nr:glycosyltransferase family 2 protein [Snowella sp.]